MLDDEELWDADVAKDTISKRREAVWAPRDSSDRTISDFSINELFGSRSDLEGLFDSMSKIMLQYDVTRNKASSGGKFKPSPIYHVGWRLGADGTHLSARMLFDFSWRL